MIREAFYELDNSSSSQFYPEELKFTQRLGLHQFEYDGHVRAGVLAKLLGKDKGDLVYWYETFTERYNKNKKCYERKRSYSTKPENVNLYEYKLLLLKKLNDTLEIAGFNVAELKSKLLNIEPVNDHCMIGIASHEGNNKQQRQIATREYE